MIPTIPYHSWVIKKNHKTMKKKFTLYIGIIMAVIAACTNEDEAQLPVVPEINLSSIQALQKSMYTRFQTTCENFDGDFELTGDTLIVEITKEDDQLFFNEYLTQTSPMFKSGNFTSSIKHKLNVKDDYFLIPERSESPLFFFYGNDTIHLNPEPNIILQQNSCMLSNNNTPFIGNDIGALENFKMGTIEHQNKIAISCVPGFFDLDAYLIYDESQLQLSYTITSSNFPTVNGWTLIDK